jgi:spectinomycin phosphotransferase
VRDWPEGVEERQLKLALAQGWGIEAVVTEYAAVGGGSYHWVVADAAGQRQFVTVDDLGEKGWLGETPAAAFEGLRTAMDTASALRRQADLQFVVAPIPTRRGETLRPLGSRYAVTVFPMLDGAGGQWGEPLSEQDRAATVDMLAVLHRSTPAAAGASVARLGLARRADLDAALSGLDHRWCTGPYGERARALLAGSAAQLVRLLARFDQLADRVAAAGREMVVTHGEPHPGNVVRVGTERLLVDWDTVGLALPERDLWWVVVSETGDEASRYVEATGRRVDPAALALYRLRWALDDLSLFVRQFRSEHGETADTEHAWASLKATVDSVLVDAGGTES